MQSSTATNNQQRLQLSHAIRYQHNCWQQGTLMILAFLLSLGVQARVGGLSQNITLSFKKATLDKVFKEIRKQTGYSFVYTESEISRANKVTMEVSNRSLDDVFSLCVQNQSFTYTIVDKIVVVKPCEKNALAILVLNKVTTGNAKKISMRGQILNEWDDPLQGATATVHRTETNTTSDAERYFLHSEIEDDAVLLISSVSHIPQQVKLSANKLGVEVKLPIAVKEEIGAAYSKVSRRNNVGAVTVVKGKEIQNLPNRSADKYLQGFVPGLLSTAGSGQSGGGLSRLGLSDIATGISKNLSGYIRNMLILLDRIPLFQHASIAVPLFVLDLPNNDSIAQLNPSDIDSIYLLKDAADIDRYDFTAANGLIFIATQKGKACKW